jgi:hypothetical protein
MRDLSYDEQALAFRFSHLPLPADAIDCEPWHFQDGDWRRQFLVREWEIAGLWVSVAGEQDRHGQVKRWLHVGGEDHCTAPNRQLLIAALVEAGHLLDSLKEAADASRARRRA